MSHETSKTVLDKILELQETILTALVPGDAQTHFRSSRKEALLGIRALLDHTIQRLDESASDGNQPEKQVNRAIKITE